MVLINKKLTTYDKKTLHDEKSVTVKFMVDIIDAYDLYKIMTQKSNQVVGSEKSEIPSEK